MKIMLQNPEIDDVLWCNSLASRKVSRRITQIYDNAIAPIGLRSTQMHVLGQLYHRRDKPPTLTELAESLVLDRSALGHNLKPLLRDQLVELIDDKDDRRQRHIVLTPKGHNKLQEALPLWALAHRKFSSLYGEKEMESLRDTLNAIAHDVRLS